MRISTVSNYPLLRKLMVGMMLFMLCKPAFSQIDVTVGTGTATSSTAAWLNTSTSTSKYTKTISLYTAAELLGAGGFDGDIFKLRFNRQGTGEYLFDDAQLFLYMKAVPSTVTSFAAPVDWINEVNGAVLVYASNNQGFMSANGWQEFILTTPFYWNGVDNIQVYADFYRPSNPTSAINWQYTTSTGRNATLSATAPFTNITTVNGNRPNIQFEFGSPFPPSCAGNYFPAAGNLDVCPNNTELTWNAGPGASPSGYSLYFGTDGGGITSPTNLHNGTNLGLSTTYIHPGNLVQGTTYYWQIVPTNSYGTAGSCAILSFVAGAPVQIGFASASPFTSCNGFPVDLTISSYTGVLQWQGFIGGVWTNIGNLNENPLTIFPTMTSQYRANISNSACSNKYSNNAFVFISNSIPGTAYISDDTLCGVRNTNLSLVGYEGAIQWQSNTGSGWVDETNPGAQSDIYVVSPTEPTEYRAYVTGTGCPADTSNIVSVFVEIIPPPSVLGDTRCGLGTVTLQASSPDMVNWYQNATGGSIINTGPTYSPFITQTTTFYAEANTGNGSAAPLNTTYAGTVNVLGTMFDISALNSVTITQFYGHMATGTQSWEIFYRPQSYVGFSNSSAGWISLGTATGVPAAGAGVPTIIPITFNVTIPAGQTYGFYVSASGNMRITTGTSVGNILAGDSNILVKEGQAGGLFNMTATVRRFNGTVIYTEGCASSRVPVVATVNAADPLTLTNSATNLCIGSSSTLDVSSSNVNYVYSWSPSTGLNTASGPSVMASPNDTITYVVIGDDGICAASDTIKINVSPLAVAGIASAGGDSICLGNSAVLRLVGYTGVIQWQSFDGANWVNETGAGSNTANYKITPTQNTSYRALLSSGVCEQDSSNVLDMIVVVVASPVGVGGERCGSGVVNLTATGTNYMYWFKTPVGGTYVHSGATYNPTVTATTTFYVQSLVNGDFFNVGPVTNGFGAQVKGPSTDFGMQFDVLKPCMLDRVYVYPAETGTITINLRESQGGLILDSYTGNVTKFTGKTAVDLGFVLVPGVAYRLELAAGSAQLYRNTANAVYPYTVAGGPVRITGYVNPNFASGANYYWFYDWAVTTGCRSERVPVLATVNPNPATPTITFNGSLLTSSATAGNQWYFNGTPIVGATNQTLVVTQLGTYTVEVTANGCTVSSATFVYTAIYGANESNMAVYPNPVRGNVFIKTGNSTGEMKISLYDATGRLSYSTRIHTSGSSETVEMDLSNLSEGMYILTAEGKDVMYRQRINVLK